MSLMSGAPTAVRDAGTGPAFEGADGPPLTARTNIEITTAQPAITQGNFIEPAGRVAPPDGVPHS